MRLIDFALAHEPGLAGDMARLAMARLARARAATAQRESTRRVEPEPEVRR